MDNIVSNEGEKFFTKRDLIEFTYEVHGDSIKPIPVNGSKINLITRKSIEEAVKLMPLKNTAPLQNFWAPSYIFAIITDKRIS